MPFWDKLYLAIITLTTNSLPLLIDRLLADTSSESRLEAKLPSSLRANTAISRLLNRQRYLAACAVRAFRISGTNAACAIPAVAQLLTVTNELTVKLHAMMILSYIGLPAMPSIQEATRSPDAFVRALAVNGIERLGTNAGPAITNVVAALLDPDNSVRWTATNALRKLAPDAIPPQRPWVPTVIP